MAFGASTRVDRFVVDQPRAADARGDARASSFAVDALDRRQRVGGDELEVLRLDARASQLRERAAA